MTTLFTPNVPPTPYFLNIDLEIITPVEPTRMLADLGESVVILHSGPTEGGHYVGLEICAESPSPELVMMEFKALLDGLSPEGRREWESATLRQFDFGYDCESTPRVQGIQIPDWVVAAIAELDASMTITLYHETES